MDDPLWQGGAVWQLVFGQADEDGALDVLDHICRTAVGSGVDAKLFGGTSVGVVFGLRLVDGRRIVVKAHQPRERAAFLLAAHDAQLKLHKSGFPCPLPLSTPMAFGDAHATFEDDRLAAATGAKATRTEVAVDAHDDGGDVKLPVNKKPRWVASRLVKMLRVAGAGGYSGGRVLGRP